MEVAQVIPTVVVVLAVLAEKFVVEVVVKIVKPMLLVELILKLHQMAVVVSPTLVVAQTGVPGLAGHLLHQVVVVFFKVAVAVALVLETPLVITLLKLKSKQYLVHHVVELVRHV